MHLTQKKIFLRLIENICRKSPYLFFFTRYVVGRYLNKIIYDHDFDILKTLNQKGFFNNKNKEVLDVGANDGMSYKIIRKFLPKVKIVSFEPQISDYKRLKKFEDNDMLYKCYNYALSDTKSKKYFYLPYYKNLLISQIACLSKTDFITRLKNTLPIKNIENKIKFKKFELVTRKLDEFKFDTSFIKIDIEGHEYECLLGAEEMIKNSYPIIMIEYNEKDKKRIDKYLFKFGYSRYFYNKSSDAIELHSNENILNVFFFKEQHLKYINQTYEK